MPKISKKKPMYSLSGVLEAYLEKHNRLNNDLLSYDDLMRYRGAVSVYDVAGEDTLWLRVFYNEFESIEIDTELKRIYTLLMADGDPKIMKYLTIDAIDFCSFGNSKPFRVKVRNILNDNYMYMYIKKFDASRVYGLELEHLLSPDHINFLAYGSTIVEEHIMGIPGHLFIENILPSCSELEKAQLAKEFVKFNERSLMRLLGDMRSYNYVVVPIHDLDHYFYKIRAVDFDQQSYEGNYKVYLPQFFKENLPMVDLVQSKLTGSSINQYQVEERCIVAKRILSAKERMTDLLNCMNSDVISSRLKIHSLRSYFYSLTSENEFLTKNSMGGILDGILRYVTKNYKERTPFAIDY